MAYKIVRYNEKTYITVPKLTKLGLKHCFTSKDMDLGTKTNPSTKRIKENLKDIYNFLNISPEGLFSGIQTHSKNIVTVKDTESGNQDPFGRSFPNTDGLITDKKNIALITRYADCIPILIYDPKRQVQANIHSGWKGTWQEIVVNGINIMREEYESQPEDLIVVMGPSIGKDDFEVDLDVMEKFKKKFDFHSEVIARKNNKKYLIDLQGINRRRLLESGVKEENIIAIDISTYQSPLLHSYRRDGKDFGLMGAISCM
ncbi:MAG TPA: peptidoglycan editing factor PgeF [Tissierellaceae bacterium]|nr:peptidoglycan editing factor PgeF [Tissierellaceae bacterium]